MHAPAAARGSASPARVFRPGLALALTAVLGLAVACGHKALNPEAMVQGGLTAQWFDQHRQIPSNAEVTQLGQEAQGMLNRVYALPAPQPSATPIPLDMNAIRQAQQQGGVQVLLLAAYILHFHALPDAAARQLIATLSQEGGLAPLPVVKKKSSSG